ncbi:MAG TPA: MFS transporter [Roseiflexaceae bacterium]|nr:MFS transporter [Roseiflexaceae bacterium]
MPFRRWSLLSHPARRYLLHIAMQTGGLAVAGLFFNLAILALGYERSFLGLLNTAAVVAAAALSLPLWWLAGRLGLRRSLLLAALLQGGCVLSYGLWPAPGPLLLAVAVGGAASVLSEVSGAPFMMRHSDPDSRDDLFSAAAAIGIGVAGVSALLAGGLPGLFAQLLDVAPESGVAYRATFLVAGSLALLALLPLLRLDETRDERGAQAATAGIDTIPAGPPQPPPTPEPSVAPPELNTQHSKLKTALLERLPPAVRGLAERPWPVLRLLLSPFLISWGAALLIPYLNLFFKDRYDISDGALGAIFAALGIITGLASLAAPLLSRRIGKMPTIVLTQALSIPFLLALGFVPLLGVAVAAMLVRAALFNMGSPLYQAFAMEQTDESARPIVIGLLNGAYTAGYLLAPTISTLTQERYGFGPLFVATTLCYGLAAVVNFALFLRPRAGR